MIPKLILMMISMKMMIINLALLVLEVKVYIQERWHRIIPPNNGFQGEPQNKTLEEGTVIQRTGSTNGRFVAPAGSRTETLSLPYNQQGQPTSYYVVLQPLTVLSGTVAPWFNSFGGGTQYLLPGTLSGLISGGFIEMLSATGGLK